MKFIAGVEIQPSGPFGVPQKGTIVVPGAPGGTTNMTSAPIHTGSMTQVGHGTLSRFRDEAKAIQKNLSIMDLTCRLHDNFLNISLDASRGGEAYDKIVEALDRFMKHLTLTTGELFSYKILFIEGENRVQYNLPRKFEIAVTMYDLDHLSNNIETAEKMSALSDPILDKALQYYEHSMFLYDRRAKITGILSGHFRYMISEIFLNMWKAATTVVGDPTVDKDYQSRYRKLGIDKDFFEKKIEVAHKVRNDYDVAHYRLDLDRLGEIEGNFSIVKEVAERVIRDYREYLFQGKPSFTKKVSSKQEPGPMVAIPLGFFGSERPSM